jgi:mono/diheme cytochrome c family protein
MFDRPGKYQFYCTRWCGPNHWRMRGTIEVTGLLSVTERAEKPLYVTLGLDIDAPHESDLLPAARPSSERGAAVAENLPTKYFEADVYRTRTPIAVWRELRADPRANGLSDQQVWDLLAFIWRSNTGAEKLAQGQRLYAQNCAACHGETGARQCDGGLTAKIAFNLHGSRYACRCRPRDFTDPRQMLGAARLLQGKMVRGGMGTGMPYWGPIFTDDQLWSLVIICGHSNLTDAED